ncbi:MAG TPA: AAA family ATPase, partial [Pseudonocardiaceae bacterium]|nr:AAA family ATPase [Pseudonocardiaceae bacterium]
MRRLPFVARAGVIADIGAALDAARHARGGLWLVTGEAGIGKSRLAEEVAQRAEGFRVVWTWCTAAGALRPWSRVVRVLAGADTAAAQAVQQSPYLAELLAEGERPAPPHGDRETARWRLSLDLADLLAATSQPLLLVIDDLHEGDPSSLQLLVELAPSLRTMATVVLATARDGEHEWIGRRQVWGALNRLGETVRLRPFQEADIAALLSQTWGAAAPAGAVHIIAARTLGHPLLVCELIESQSDLADVSHAVPASIRAVVGARIDVLTESARRVLPTAAVLGTRFRLDVLAEVAEVSLSELGAAVSEAHAAGLFGDAEPGEGRFRHDLIRDAVYEALTVDQRALLHHRAGTVLAVFAHRGRDVEAAQVADHLLRAGLGSASDAAEFAGRAGEAALRRFAF